MEFAAVQLGPHRQFHARARDHREAIDERVVSPVRTTSVVGTLPWASQGADSSHEANGALGFESRPVTYCGIDGLGSGGRWAGACVRAGAFWGVQDWSAGLVRLVALGVRLHLRGALSGGSDQRVGPGCGVVAAYGGEGRGPGSQLSGELVRADRKSSRNTLMWRFVHAGGSTSRVGA